MGIAPFLLVLGPMFLPQATARGNPEDGLVARWVFNEQSGSLVHDSAGHSFHGALQGGRWTNGASFYDGAVGFDGVSDKVIVPGSGLPPPAALGVLAYGSIVVRFRFPPTGSGDIIPLFYFGESSSGTAHNSLIIEIGHGQNPANRRLYFTIVNARFCYDSGTNLPPDNWHHFVAVVGTNGNTGYLNGQEMTRRNYNLGSDATYTNFFSSVPVQKMLAFAYGRFGQQDPFYHGPAVISDVRIYNRPLNAAEAQELYARSDDPGMLQLHVQHLPASNDLVLRWEGTTGYLYSVWGATNLGPAAWLPVANRTNLTGLPGWNTTTLSVDTERFRCFRISAER